MAQSVEFELAVLVEKREETEWAATTTPFAITMYGASADEARERALQAVLALLDRHEDDPSAYLERRNVPHQVKKRAPKPPPVMQVWWSPLLEARHNVHYEVPRSQKVAAGA